MTFLGPRAPRELKWIAFVGSRDWPQPKFVAKVVSHLDPAKHGFVSGGAKGVDTWAFRAALNRGLKLSDCQIFKPNYAHHGRSAPKVRNEQIVTAASTVVAFQYRGSGGTQNSVDHARRLGKRLVLFPLSTPEGEPQLTIEEERK